ncbi:hypothetical protein I551_8569 [Mycobacterium ulcerans str. Harvey]|uniref:Uncharacterized protein n=1 Tax=Mycobacterium ulcerans str. Harvey TaxID=1299332 RepID=A0ABN0RAF4_MYCUL|nr:hypothetical protein I551_8569 [Mycobacterium ulcerans str. Harvey]
MRLGRRRCRDLGISAGHARVISVAALGLTQPAMSSIRGQPAQSGVDPGPTHVHV